MSVRVFNAALALGWLLVLGGGVWISPGWGIAAAGGLLIVLTLVAVRICGGLYGGPAPRKGEGA